MFTNLSVKYIFITETVEKAIKPVTSPYTCYRKEVDKFLNQLTICPFIYS